MEALPSAAAPHPPDEAARLLALAGYEILDTPAEQSFDDLAALGAHIAQSPISLISLIDADRQWFKSRVGVVLAETRRDISFCSHVVVSREPLIVPDVQRDPRFANNPLVVAEPGIRFYAGFPLVTPDDHVIGTLCVLDVKPRTLSVEQGRHLLALSRQVMHQLELRRTLRLTRQAAARAGLFFERAPDLFCVVGADGFVQDANTTFLGTLGLEMEALRSRPLMEQIHPDDQATFSDAIGALVAGEQEEAAFSARAAAQDGWRTLSWRVRGVPRE
ncbi:MAG: PAS domain S-box-containing protein, partial [Myxococcota bacterium]